jgi:hypothetical protein
MKQNLVSAIGGIVATVVATVVGGIVMWKLEPHFKDSPEERKVHTTMVASSQASAKSANRSLPNTSIPSGSESSAKSPSQPGDVHYVNDALLSDRKPITPVAVKGNADASRDVLDALAVPLTQGVFTRSFFSDGIFERALNGEGRGIAQIKLPKVISKIVLLKVGELQKTSISDAQGAIKIKRHVTITVMAAQSGAVIKAVKFVAEGVGFDEEIVERSLKEDLATKLEPVRRSL